jgi:hypothetical protein
MKETRLRYFIIGTFITLYAIVSLISTIHVIEFFRLSNPNWLAVSLAIAFEIGAAASLASLIALKKMNRSLVWGLFIVLTAMQMMGNTYYAFKNLENYQDWVDLFGLTDDEPIFQKRILSIISGAVLPLVALGFIKSLVDYIKPSEEEPVTASQTAVNDQITDSVTSTYEPVNEPVTEPVNEGGYVMGKDELRKIFERVETLREEGKLPAHSQEDIENEPTALAFTPYVNEEDVLIGEKTIETTEEFIHTEDEKELIQKLSQELSQEDIQTYIEKSRTPSHKNNDEDENPHLMPGVRT